MAIQRRHCWQLDEGSGASLSGGRQGGLQHKVQHATEIFPVMHS